jgi:hypothetical protein
VSDLVFQGPEDLLSELLGDLKSIGVVGEAHIGDRPPGCEFRTVTINVVEGAVDDLSTALHNWNRKYTPYGVLIAET